MKRYGSDFKKIDAHTVRPHEYKEAPEWTDAQIASADLHENGRLIRRKRITARMLAEAETYLRRKGQIV